MALPAGGAGTVRRGMRVRGGAGMGRSVPVRLKPLLLRRHGLPSLVDHFLVLPCPALPVSAFYMVRGAGRCAARVVVVHCMYSS